MDFSNIIILDIEASGFSDESYPVEIAWVSLDKTFHDSFLVKPDEDWSYWDEMSQYIHGLCRSVLQLGISPQDSAERLNKILLDKQVYSDAVQWDTFWIDRLYQKTDQKRDWQIIDIREIYDNYDLSYVNPGEMHRALSDADAIANSLLEFLSS